MKRILSLLVAMIMALGCVGITAMAEEAAAAEVATYEALVEALAAGNNVKLTTDITTTAALKTSGITATIDLNGKTLSVRAGDNKFTDESDITIKNGTINIDGVTVNGNAIFCLDEYEKTLVTTLTLENVDLEGKDYSSAYGVFYIGASSVLNVNGGNWVLSNDTHASGGVFKADDAKATLNISNVDMDLHNVRRVVTYANTAVENSALKIYGDADGVDAEMEHGFNRSPLAVTNSTITMTDMVGRGITAECGAVSISDNSTVTIENVQEATIDVRGNQTVTVSADSAVTVDKEPTVSSGGTISGTISPSSTVSTEEEFVKALAEGGKIKLASDITINTALFTSGVTATIDLNGKTLNVRAGDNRFEDVTNLTFENGTINIDGVVASANAIFRIDEYEKTLVTTVTLNDVNVTGSNYSSAFGIFYIGASSVLNVNGGTWTLSNDKYSAGGVFKADSESATLNISGATMDLHNVRRVVTYADTTIEDSTLKIYGDADGVDDEMKHGFNYSPLTIDNSTITMSDMNGRGITAVCGDVNIKNGSSVTITNSQEATIDVRGNQTVTVSADSAVTVDKEPTVTNGTINGTVSGPEPAIHVATVNGITYTSLKDALDAAAAGTGNVTVEILTDIDLTNVDWSPVTVSAPGYPVVTVNGNNKIITGLNDMLFAGTWAGDSGLIINDLTIAESNIVNDKDDSKGTVGVGAFIGYPQASATITLNNCHLVDSTVEGGHWTGGLIGMAGGYNGNDGPVFMNLTIRECSVTGSTITGKGSVGGIIGHGSCAAWTNVVITDTTVSNNTITSTGSSNVKAGAVMGTIGAAGQSTTANGETKTGGASVSATVSGNTVTSNGTTITTIYGRQGTDTGMLYVTGGTYENNPVEENVSYAQPAEGYEIVQNEDGTYGVQEKAPQLPNATVTVLDSITLKAGEYSVWNGSLQESTEDLPLEIVMNFKANDTVEESIASGYNEWLVDFNLKFTGLETGSITADNCYLAGKYGDNGAYASLGWIAIPTNGMVLEENVSYPVVATYDPTLNYNDICTSVKDFTAAIHVDQAILDANPNFKVELSLVMTNPDDPTDTLIIGEPAVYTAEDLKNEKEETFDSGVYVLRTFNHMTIPETESKLIEDFGTDQAYRVRVYAAVEKASDYTELGFIYKLAGADDKSAQSGKIKTLYKKVTITSENEGIKPFAPKDFRKDGEYIFALNIWMHPDFTPDTAIEVKPYGVRKDGKTIYGPKWIPTGAIGKADAE